MADEFEHLLHSLEGAGPSDEFVARLRSEVMAEVSEATIVHLEEPATGVDVWADPLPAARSGPTWFAAAALAAVALLGVLVLLNRSAGSELDTLDDPAISTTTTTTPEATTVDEGAAAPEPLPGENELVEAGRHASDVTGTRISLELTDRAYVRLNGQGSLVLAHINGGGPDDRDLSFFRLTGLSGPSVPDPTTERSGFGWPAEDLVGWLDALDDGVEVTGVAETMVGGRSAVVADLHLPEGGCTPGLDYCMDLGSNHGAFTKALYSGSTHRVWVVEQGQEDPLAIVASIIRPQGMDGFWLETAAEIVDSIQLGSPGANPIAPSGAAIDGSDD